MRTGSKSIVQTRMQIAPLVRRELQSSRFRFFRLFRGSHKGLRVGSRDK